eukprot:CAMPEP_0194384512 /NCGR_PEP_ID=MMETSP0174-20130528/74557_1 /TAXON_ID=216777 /ORGANISM="Proboscia alata, Strain PI-D3" /LENGTH=67 /DNA_ID=CAMNT_0039171767 /DNA_START=82 /DNA_END=281 /DNA_ORIENTATION=-
MKSEYRPFNTAANPRREVWGVAYASIPNLRSRAWYRSARGVDVDVDVDVTEGVLVVDEVVFSVLMVV